MRYGRSAIGIVSFNQVLLANLTPRGVLDNSLDTCYIVSVKDKWG